MTEQAMPADSTLVPALSIKDLTLDDGEPRVRDLRLADALGFAYPIDIRKLIRRHSEALTRFGAVFATRQKPGPRGGRPGTEYHLNKRQALYITAKSDTSCAADVTVAMVEVFDAYLTGRPDRVPVKAHDRARRALPISLNDGLAVMSIGGRTVVVDTKATTVGARDEAAVLTVNGTIEVISGLDYRDLPTCGATARTANTSWQDASPEQQARGILQSRSPVTVIGAVLRNGEAQRALCAA